MERYRVVEQMNDLIKDHRIFGYVEKVDYRAIKEPGQPVDYIIRYYPGEGAKRSINRIRSYRPRKKKPAQRDLPLSKVKQLTLPPSGVIHATDLEIEALVARLTNNPPEGFGVSEMKARELIKANRRGVEEQIAAYPYRDMGKTKKNAAGWIIAAIEGNYTLPVTYLEEREKKRLTVEVEVQKETAEKCPFCDPGGWRRILTPEYPTGVVMRCSHDPAKEAKF
jgi:hypothetical protein